MKMKLYNNKYYLLILLALVLTFNACNKKGDGLLDPVDLRDRAEQQLEDKAELVEYLQTHYYNSGDFNSSNLNPSIEDLVITKLEEGETLPSGNSLLIDSITIKTTTYFDVEYDYYFLQINKGGGETPHFTDQIRLTFTGNLLSGEIFDSSITPIDFDLTALLPGWGRVIPEFSASESYVEAGDGTIDYSNFGLGVMFLPSGLAYFSEVNPGIPEYSQLVFKFEIYQTEVSDHDNDGVPSYLEDLNGNLDMFDDDTDSDSFPNFTDTDDDGDGVFTIDELEPIQYIVDTNIGETEPILDAKEFEISRSEDAGVITINTVKIVDSNNDGLDDFLDESITINYNEES
jgi:hypothetical protein